MPPPGFGSITMPQDIIDYFREEWEQQKGELRKKGVTTFTGFLTMMLYEYIEQRKRNG